MKFGRRNRFLIDDEDSPLKLAYTLSKPLKLGWSHNGEGIYKFVLQEVNSTDDDNQELGIADYYLHFPADTGSGSTENDGGEESAGNAGGSGTETGDASQDDTGTTQATAGGKKVWL